MFSRRTLHTLRAVWFWGCPKVNLEVENLQWTLVDFSKSPDLAPKVSPESGAQETRRLPGPLRWLPLQLLLPRHCRLPRYGQVAGVSLPELSPMKSEFLNWLDTGDPWPWVKFSRDQESHLYAKRFHSLLSRLSVCPGLDGWTYHAGVDIRRHFQLLNSKFLQPSGPRRVAFIPDFLRLASVPRICFKFRLRFSLCKAITHVMMV